MTFRRAALLAVATSVAACDVVAFASDPKPIFEQTWNIPASATSISVGELIPANVSIYSTPASNPPDSSAFVLNISNVVFTSRVGDSCAQCNTLNGTSTTKPAFVLNAGSSSALPPDVVSSAVLGGTVTVSVVNNLSFDPIRVRALNNPPQGYMVILVHSGSLVLGKDSVNGADVAFAPGSVITRPIVLSSGTVNAPVAVDLTVNSPQGDHNEFINANGTLRTTAAITGFLAGNVTINVPNKTISNPPADVDLGDFGTNVVEATFEMSIENPWTVAGNLQVNFASPSITVSKAVAIPAGSTPVSTQVRSITLDQADIQSLQGKKLDVTITGTMNALTPVTVTPKQQIAIDNRLVVKVHTGGGN
jgi:hypothetical protein